MSREPILSYSELTGRVYIVTEYELGMGWADRIVSQRKFDVTDQFEAIAQQRAAETKEQP